MEGYSIIVPVFNNIEYTAQMYNSFLAHQPDEAWEIIFIDNGSIDGTGGYLKGIMDACNDENPKSRMKVITNQTNLGFPKAVNQGIAAAAFDLLVILNNDVILTPGWIRQMRQCLDKSGEKLKISRIGMVGPATNFAGGPQLVPKAQYSMDQLAEYARAFHRENRGNWFETGFLSGFCMLVKKEVFTEAGNFNEELTPGGFEDNHLLLKASAFGWKAVVAGDTFVHHFGSRTLDSVFPEMERGLANREKFYRMRIEVPETIKGKLVAVYRVKNNEDTVKESLEKTSEFADEIIFLDDGSTDRTGEIAQTFPRVWYERQDLPFNERRDRNRIISLARERQAEWIISVDGDEVFEDKFNREYAERLMNPPNPEVKSYNFTWMTFVFGRTHYRTDAHWGNMQGFRMFRNEPEREITDGNADGLHCFNVPVFPQWNCRKTSVRIKHYGYDSPEKARQKFEFYERIDRDKRPDLIGNTGYSHVLMDGNLKLMPWVEDNGISLVMVVKNEEKRMPQVLEGVWSFVDEIVVVDTGSTDRTAELAEMFGARVFHRKMDNNFADVRNFAKDQARSRWCLHLDPDESFDLNKLPELRQMMEHQCHGYLFQVMNHHMNGRGTISEAVRFFRNIPELTYYGRVHETFDRCLPGIKDLKLWRAPFPIHHHGYLKKPEDVDKKIKFYNKLNALQMQDDPTDPMPYYNLALHHFNIGDEAEGRRLLEVAIKKRPSMWLAKKELAYHHLFQAKDMLNEICDQLPAHHPFWKYASKMAEFLERNAGSKITVGTETVKEDEPDGV